jgi:hypothetical protein
MGYKKFRTPLDAIFGSYPMDIFIPPLGYRFCPLGYESIKHLIFAIFYENLLRYPVGKFKLKNPPPPPPPCDIQAQYIICLIYLPFPLKQQM